MPFPSHLLHLFLFFPYCNDWIVRWERASLPYSLIRKVCKLQVFYDEQLIGRKGGAVVTISVSLGLLRVKKSENFQTPLKSEILKCTQPPPSIPSFLDHLLSIHHRQSSDPTIRDRRWREWLSGSTPGVKGSITTSHSALIHCVDSTESSFLAW